MSSKLPQLLVERRKRMNMTQEDVATAIGKGIRAYQYYEDGTTTPRPDTLLKLATLLQFEPREIYEDAGKLHVEQNFRESRLNKKNAKANPVMVPLIPVKAQAGYVKAMDQSTFIDTLEQYALPPGVNPHGAIWRYWEVEGDSMEPAFHEGDVILTSQVHQMDWENMRNFYLYVIVTPDRVLFKRIFCKNPLEWVLISENEDNYPQQILPVEYIKEVWVFRRSIMSKAPPSKEFKINV